MMRVRTTNGRRVYDTYRNLPTGPFMAKKDCTHPCVSSLEGGYEGFVCRRCGLWQETVDDFGEVEA